MESLIVSILSYVIIIGLLYAPKCPQIRTNPVKAVKKRAKYTDPNQLALDFDSINYRNKTIRELKKLASQAKIKRYSSLTKFQLIQALEAA